MAGKNKDNANKAPLEWATVDELLDELGSRCVAMVFGAEFKDGIAPEFARKDDETFYYLSGKRHAQVGLATRMLSGIEFYSDVEEGLYMVPSDEGDEDEDSGEA